MAIINSSEDPIPKRVRDTLSAPVTPPVRLLTPEVQPEDQAENGGLRPRRLADYAGQSELKDVLQVAIDAARRRQEPLDHLLLHGPPGLGKTTMAQIVAAEMGVPVRITSAPALERPRDIAGLLATLQPGEVLFIDEIHRLSRLAEELLYPAMEDFSLDITIGKGQTARTRRLPLPRFTLIGATTRAGALSAPLRDRFGLIQRLNFYREDELVAILHRAADIFGLVLEPSGALAMARRARGTPRVANRLLRRVRDFSEVNGGGAITEPVAAAALDRLGVDPSGLEPLDRQLLTVIIDHHRGGPVGLETVAAALGEDPATIEDIYEPYLMQAGFLARTPRGRVVNPKAYAHLGLPHPASFTPLFSGRAETLSGLSDPSKLL
ncbi:MAG: Holliday junction branch migration DNA helicase RuvB [Candidatus Sericytochromatia bacterium]|nr:Holliday junction branch migration DNA helicase RuvB [Candidatus Sericytochromatia bacterium]